MSTCKKARAEATSVLCSDRLSSLPPEMKGNILSRLNVREAVRTSTLSSTWRDAWTNMPNIFLCDGNFTRTKFVPLVDMVLSLHKGTIEEFVISGNKSYHDEFGRWMLMLSRRSPSSVYDQVELRAKQYLSKGCILTKLPAVFTRLQNIHLVICFWDQRQVLTAVSLFQNAPNLKKLELWSYSPSTWDQDQASIQELTVQMQMDHLVTATVKGFWGLDCEVDFVAKLLSWAPVLEEVKIEWRRKTDCSMVLAKLLTLPRVSPKAKVIVTF